MRPRNTLATDPADAGIQVLIVTPNEADYATLRHILSPTKWFLTRATTLQTAQRHLNAPDQPFSLAVCERDLRPGSWKEMLDSFLKMADPPLLIVSSLFADEHLWAEVLNLGAYDVLVKPFEREEVRRVLTSGWLRWVRKETGSRWRSRAGTVLAS